MSDTGEHVSADAVSWPAFGAPARVPQPIRRNAHSEAKEAARTEGYEEGRLAGLTAARQEVDALKQQLRNAIAALGQARIDVTDDQVAALIEVSRAVCRRVLGVEMRTNDGVFAALIRAGVDHLGNTTPPIRVHVHPDELDWLAQVPPGDVELIADEGIGPGAVSVRDQRRTVDIDLLAELDRVFAQALND
jgi:flagellar biosynthesis/type III secretory pathway protein FliH